MTIKELYICNYCGATYDTEEKCLICETNHKTELTIEVCKYIPINADPMGLPRTIEIGYTDGDEPKRAIYKRLQG